MPALPAIVLIPALPICIALTAWVWAALISIGS